MLVLTMLPAPWGAIGDVLLLAVIGLLAYGFFAHRYDDLRLGRMPKRTELPQSFLLIVLAAIVWLSAAQNTVLSTLGLLTLAGIACGFAGDLFMADAFGQKDHVLYGMLAFALGHVFYMLGFREIALTFGLHTTASYVLALLVMWVIALLIWFFLVREPTGDQTMQRMALGYALFLASMAGYAIGLALQQAAFWPLAIGGLLFLLSDSLIAARLFGGRRFRYMGDWIWGTYIIAQVLIVTAVPVALRLLQ